MKLGNTGYPNQNSLACLLFAFAPFQKTETVLCTMDSVNKFTFIRTLIWQRPGQRTCYV